MVGLALSYDGVDDRASLGDPDSLKFTASMSIEGWIQANAFTTTTNGNVILFRGDSRGGLDPYYLHVNPNGTLQFGVHSGTRGVSVVSPTPIPLGQLIHVAATLDDATGEMKLYINGAVAAQALTTIRPFRDLDPAQNPAIGIGNANSTYNVPFNGLIDELAVYNRALTAGEVQGIHSAGSDGKIRMIVARTSPDLGSFVSTTPTSFAVEFSFPYNAATLQPNQFQVNGIQATSVTQTDLDTVTFTFASSPVTNEGLQTMHLDAGAVTRASDGLAAAEYTGTFRYDSVPMQVTSTDPVIGGNLMVQSLTSPTRAVASMAGMRDGNGGWPLLYGSSPVGDNGLQLAIEEDNLFDTERSHFPESVAFLALNGATSGNSAPYLRTGVVSGVTNADWTTVTLDRAYASMVVVATPNYSNTSPPLVARVQNANGNSFQIKVDRVDGQTGTVVAVSVQYVVVEEGVYTVAEHGVKMEAIKFNSSVTDRSSSWVGQNRSYAQLYASPVVLGQVMTTNDPAFSVFWARGEDRFVAPSSSALYVGKHIGEDPDTTRADETIGYVVIEGGLGSFGFGGPGYLAGIGANTVQGIVNDVPTTYALTSATLRVNLNEPFDPASFGTTDLTLSLGAVTGAAAVDADTVQYTLVGVPRGAKLSVRMADGALKDSFGNPLVAPFTADYQDGLTRFYVVNDATERNGIDRTYEYGSFGNSVENYALASGNTAPRGATTTATGNKVWVVDANLKVYVYNPSGGILGSWKLSGATGSAQLEGIATDGIDIWVVDNKLNAVMRYGNGASALSGAVAWWGSFILAPGNTNPKGIVTDGTSFWVVDDSTTDKVFKYTLSGSLLGSWTIDAANASPTGLTINPGNVSDIWIVDNGTDKVYQYAAAAGRTSGSQSAVATFALAAGNTNPQDIANPPTPDMVLTSVTTVDQLANPRYQAVSLGAHASYHTRLLNSSAGVWGWFAEKRTQSDSAFRTRSNQSEQSRIDLPSALKPETGHILGLENNKAGVMTDALFAGIRRSPIFEGGHSHHLGMDWLSIFGPLLSR